MRFNIEKFKKFKDKIIYIVVDKQPPDIQNLLDKDSAETRGQKLILNGMARDYFQRESLAQGLTEAKSEDLILISDLDEIPDLSTMNISLLKNKIILFEQKMFYYKLNLFYEEYKWFGTKELPKKFNIPSVDKKH